MSEHLRALLTQVLALPEIERQQLISEVLESLQSTEEVESAWTVELRRRIDEVRSGKADLIEWSEARKLIHGSRG